MIYLFILRTFLFIKSNPSGKSVNGSLARLNSPSLRGGISECESSVRYKNDWKLHTHEKNRRADTIINMIAIGRRDGSKRGHGVRVRNVSAKRI